MSRKGVLCALVFVQLSFSGYGILVKKYAQQEKADPHLYATLRDVGAFPVLLLAAIKFEGWYTPRTWRQCLLLSLLGAFGVAGNQYSNIKGLYFTSPGTAVIFQPLIPVVTAILSILIGLEPCPNISTLTGKAKILGILSAVEGAIIMVYVTGDNKTTEMINPHLGFVYLFLHIFCMAVYIVLQKWFIFSKDPIKRIGMGRILNSRLDDLKLAVVGYRSRPITVTAWSYGFGALFMLLSCAFDIPADGIGATIPPNTYIPLIYAIFISSALNYAIISWANSQLHPSLVTALWPLQVPTVAILSFIVFGDTLTGLQLFGGFMIAVGLLAVTWADYFDKPTGSMVGSMKVGNNYPLDSLSYK